MGTYLGAFLHRYVPVPVLIHGNRHRLLLKFNAAAQVGIAQLTA